MRNRLYTHILILYLTIVFANSYQAIGQAVGDNIENISNESLEIYNYAQVNNFIIGDVTVSGIRFLNSTSVLGTSGLAKGQSITIPGSQISDAARRLWEQGLFSDVKISYKQLVGDTIAVNIALQERPRIAAVEWVGIRSGDKEDLEEKVNIRIGSQVSSYMLDRTVKLVEQFYIEKGFLNTEVSFIQKDNPQFPNSIVLTINVNRNKKVKIDEISFVGNDSFSEKKLRRQMKGTKQINWNIFKSSKYVSEKFEEDKMSLFTFYNDNGFKDFEIISDSLYTTGEDRMGIRLHIEEGDQYFLRDITWVGNSIYDTTLLNSVMAIERGTVYNPSLILDRLQGASGATDAVNNLYLNNGYLFSSVTPIEKTVENDSIDLEIRVYEGEQAYLNNITIKGNTRTNEHVARRELYTSPGDLFSKDAIIRSVRELGVLGYWDAEKINPIPIQNAADGTVDLVYELEETPNDQFEISGGWGAGMIIGSVGISFNNFSMKRFFDFDQWKPYPSGDGQSLSIRAQTNGRVYQSYSFSFSEPWLGGKKPNSFSASIYMSRLTNGSKKNADGFTSMNIYGASVGVGTQLHWPDDYFSASASMGFQRYNMNNFTSSTYSFMFTNGIANMFSVTGQIRRYSVSPNVIYPRTGSSYSLQLQITPPYSLFSNKDYSSMSQQDKYRWIEFHKWTFKTENYFPLTRDNKMILAAKFAFGYLGHYNSDLGPSPFEKFSVGGDGMSGYTFYGQDIIKLRGYDEEAATAHVYNEDGYYIASGNVYSKITFELRYPLMMNEQSTIYAAAFAETGKAWYSLKEYNPFKMQRALGVGVRAYLPMIGFIGIDWGYGFDSSDYIKHVGSGNGSQWQFVMGQEF